MKYLLLALILAGCGGGESGAHVDPSENSSPIVYPDFILAGQSNANVCNWGYFESKTNSVIHNIALGGRSIDQLISEYESLAIDPRNVKGIIFVHGEADSSYETDPDYYTERVEYYRKLISEDVGIGLPLYISTVGYRADSPYLDLSFKAIRDAVLNNNNPQWHIVFNYAQYFMRWGMLKDDNIHFNQYGCELMMQTISDDDAINKALQDYKELEKIDG